MWCLGEFADQLVNGQVEGEDSTPVCHTRTRPLPIPSLQLVSHLYSAQVEEGDVVGLMAQLLKSPGTSPVTKDYIINALMKLTARFSPAVRYHRLTTTCCYRHKRTAVDCFLPGSISPIFPSPPPSPSSSPLPIPSPPPSPSSSPPPSPPPPQPSPQLLSIIQRYKTSMDAEIQQRAVEYDMISVKYSAMKTGLLEKMPPMAVGEEAGTAKESPAQDTPSGGVVQVPTEQEPLKVRLCGWAYNCGHTCMHTHACTHTCMHAHACTHTCMHTRMYARMHTHACTHTRAHTRTHTHTCAHAHTHTHTHTHTHAGHSR